MYFANGVRPEIVREVIRSLGQHAHSAEVGIDPVKIEIDPSILDRFEIDSIQIMGLERQIDLTLKWS